MNHFHALLQSHPLCGGIVLDAIACDGVAVAGVLDLIEEEQLMNHPIEVGCYYLFQTVTLYFAGRVTSVEPCWVHLEDASWVHRTGRLSTLLKHGFDRSKFNVNPPRTEYVGAYTIAVSSLIGFMRLPGSPPKESIQ